MTKFRHREFYTAVRPFFGNRLTQAQVDILSVAVDKCVALMDAGPSPVGPPWLAQARKDIGLREIPGRQHSPRILQMLKYVDYPFSDDETPWCGTAMATWIKEAGLTPAPKGYRAANWADWGTKCAAQLGAIGVKKRTGGNHVFLIVGETSDRTFYKCLGANQGNMVSIMDIRKSDVFAIRWPTGVPQMSIPLPIMPRGVISRNEA